jgi:pantoate--beta-alanine ligase
MSATAGSVRAAGGRIALVPTMGALHDGHLALIRRAAELAETVVVSLFVNPTQFGPNEDYDRYPRPIETDVAALADLGLVDVLFAPTQGDMYPDGPERHLIWIDTSSLDRTLCGAHRPGHFRAVATVVAKLFNVCRPHVAIFGLKDAQQYVIVSRMVADLNFDVEVVGVPTQREPGGLAMSTRNLFLTSEELEEAVVLSEAVAGAARMIEGGETDPEVIEAEMRRDLSRAKRAVVQYASVVDAATLEEIRLIRPGQRVLSAVAVYFGSTRLIDNTFSVARGR